MENKSNKGLIIIIVILTLLLVGVSGYLVYDKFLIEEKVKDESKDEEKEEENKIKNLETTSKVVQDAMQSFNFISLFEEDLYKNDVYTVNSISDAALIGIALNLADDDKIAFCTSDLSDLREEVSIEELNKGLSKYILDRKISIDLIKSQKKESSYPIADYEFGGYGVMIGKTGVKIVGPCGGEFGPDDFVETQVIKAEEDDNYIYIYGKLAFGTHVAGADDTIDVNYYDNYDHKGTAKQHIKEGEDDILDWSLYNTYKYTFKKSNGNYYFEKFEKI